MSTANILKRFKPMRHKQSGLSLVELMIGLVLGLVVVSAVFNTYVGSTRSSKFSEGLQRMQENGRYGVATLQQGIRLAGYAPTGDLKPFDIALSDENTLVVQTMHLYDCNGISTAANDGIAVNTYTHDDQEDTVTCTGNGVGAAPMPIVEGVESVRFLYGVNTNSDDIPDQYVVYDPTLNPDQIISVRVALLISSVDPIRTRASEETHVLFDREVTTNDKIARNVFTSTVLLRNRKKDI